MLRSLLWKEWREHRWKALGILLTCLAFLLACRLFITRHPLELFQYAMNYLSFLLAAFIAMEACTEDRANKTFDTALNLPLPAPAIFYHRCLWDLLTLTLPMLAAQLSAYLFFDATARSLPGVLPTSSWLLLPAASACSLYAWIVLCCARFRAQVKVAIAALFILLAHYLAWMLLNHLLSLLLGDFYAYTPRPLWDAHYERWLHIARLCNAVFFVFSPITFFLRGDIFAPAAPSLALVCSLVLLIPASYRYATSAPRFVRFGLRFPTPSAPTRAQRLPILWKTWGESRHFICLYLLAAFLIISYSNATTYSLFSRGIWLASFGNVSFIYGLASLLSYGSLFAALIIGGNIGITDFEHRLDHFWLSRPLHPPLYFYRRYFSGLLITLTTFIVPCLFYVLLALYGYLQSPRGYAFRYGFDSYPLQLAEIPFQTEFQSFWTVPQLCLVYGISVFSAAFIRQRILAMLLAATLSFFVPLGAFVQLLASDFHLLPLGNAFRHEYAFPDHLRAYLFLSLFVLLPLSLLLAKLASYPFLHDWKSHLEHLLSRLRPPRSLGPSPKALNAALSVVALCALCALCG